ncbi:MAG: hypothetical protein ACKO96_27255 [Flammeovirgaceae bacterium]
MKRNLSWQLASHNNMVVPFTPEDDEAGADDEVEREEEYDKEDKRTYLIRGIEEETD